MALLKAAATGWSSPPPPPLSTTHLVSPSFGERTKKRGFLSHHRFVSSPETFEFCAREACQIFGGLAYSRGGQGEKIERLYRDAKAYRCVGFLPLLFSR